MSVSLSSHEQGFKSFASFSVFPFIFILCGWVFGLHVGLCNVCMLGAQGGQKGASGPLELEIQVFVNCCVGTRDGTLVLRRSSQGS